MAGVTSELRRLVSLEMDNSVPMGPAISIYAIEIFPNRHDIIQSGTLVN